MHILSDNDKTFSPISVFTWECCQKRRQCSGEAVALHASPISSCVCKALDCIIKTRKDDLSLHTFFNNWMNWRPLPQSLGAAKRCSREFIIRRKSLWTESVGNGEERKGQLVDSRSCWAKEEKMVQNTYKREALTHGKMPKVRRNTGGKIQDAIDRNLFGRATIFFLLPNRKADSVRYS